MKIWFAISGIFICLCASAQRINYRVAFPNAAHHEARITVEISGAKESALYFRMSRSSPGRYATHEFGKNVYDVEAVDAANRPLPLKKVEGDMWQVTGVKGTAKLTYTLYANYADGTYAGVDANSIHLNMPASFMWVKNYEKAPITIQFDVQPTSFTIATQLKPGKDKWTFTAPNLDYFMDSPVKIGALNWRSWPVDNGKQQIKIALEADATKAGADSLAAMVQMITAQARAVFGEYPAFDFGTYTFLASINPFVRGDGMEHRNSTMITIPQNFSATPDLLEVFSHEFFHCWNVERIRPKTLQPFDFEKANMSNELWCAEGFTQYYGSLLLVRAGFEHDTAFKNNASAFINQKTNTPGGKFYTPIQSSNLAVFTDAGVAVDRTNYQNIFSSYYYYGASIALALDLTLRSEFNSSLDVFMQEMWKRHGKPFVPYTVADMENTLAAISNKGFAKNFFDQYVYHPNAPDYQKLLAYAGFELKTAAPGKAWVGNISFREKKGLAMTSNTVRNTPLYEAGLDIDDEILAVAGKPIRTQAEWNDVLKTLKPGEKVTITYLHRNIEKTTSLTPRENPMKMVVTFESLGKPVTPPIIAFRKAWLGAK